VATIHTLVNLLKRWHQLCTMLLQLWHNVLPNLRVFRVHGKDVRHESCEYRGQWYGELLGGFHRFAYLGNVRGLRQVANDLLAIDLVLGEAYSINVWASKDVLHRVT
jgi:hypothetical protein